MIIKSLILENIRSYESVKINFPEGSILLAGDIGSGKTTILLAIEFALFGLQPGQKGSSLLRNDKNQGKIILELEIEGKQIIIERRLKRGKSVTQDYASISIDNNKQEKSIQEIKNQILQLLNYPQEFAKKTNLLYKFTVYTPQEEMKQIILENPETRLNTLRHVFGIDKYKKIKENTALFTSKLREEIRGSQLIIQDLQTKKQHLQEKQKLVENLRKDLENQTKIFQQNQEARKKIELELEEVNKKIQEKNNFEKEIERTKILFSSKREMIILQNQIKEANKFPFSQEKLDKQKKEKSETENKKEQTNKTYLDIQSQISSLNLQIQENLKLKQQILNLKLCPTCLQNVDNEYKENIINKFNKQNKANQEKISELTKEKNELIKNIEDFKGQITDLDEKINNLAILKTKIETLSEKEEKISQLEKQKISLEKDLEILDKHIIALKQSILEFSKYENVYSRKEQEFKQALQQERESDLKIAEIKKEIQLTTDLIEEIKLEIKQKESIKNKLLYITEIEDWLSNKFIDIITLTERNVMLKLREEFSKLFNEWFNILVPDIFQVRLDEDFTPIIEQQDYELDYNFLSGGERTAIALAYRLALNQTINSLLSQIKTKDLVILDEPTDGFSEAQLDKMRDVLMQLKVSQLILVSHEAKIESFVENIIKFKKENNVSRVDVQN